MVLQMLDGPYIAFVASVKLEGAYLAISQRDVEAEAEEARLKKLQVCPCSDWSASAIARH
jgi:hypothetical protein